MLSVGLAARFIGRESSQLWELGAETGPNPSSRNGATTLGDCVGRSPTFKVDGRGWRVKGTAGRGGRQLVAAAKVWCATTSWRRDEARKLEGILELRNQDRPGINEVNQTIVDHSDSGSSTIRGEGSQGAPK